MTLATELLMLVGVPIIAVYAAYRVYVAVIGRFRPWEVGVPGLGGALWFLSQTIHVAELCAGTVVTWITQLRPLRWC